MDNLVTHLRLDAEMMKDGAQRNLTELWHSEVVAEAAKHCAEAADRIEAFEARVRKLEVVAREASYALEYWPGAYPRGLEAALSALTRGRGASTSPSN